nr:MAG: hypothetical protein [Bacteriophage sp.]
MRVLLLTVQIKRDDLCSGTVDSIRNINRVGQGITACGYGPGQIVRAGKGKTNNLYGCKRLPGLFLAGSRIGCGCHYVNIGIPNKQVT